MQEVNCIQFELEGPFILEEGLIIAENFNKIKIHSNGRIELTTENVEIKVVEGTYEGENVILLVD
jgi:hypothetical protein